MCIFNSTEKACLEQTETISTLKIKCFQNYSFQTLTQFSLGNNVLNAAASTIDYFLCRDTCVSSTQLIRLVWKKMNPYPLWNYDLQEVFLLKTNSSITGKNMQDVCVSNKEGLFSTDTYIWTSQVSRLFG
jgi:hypothetical protein